MVAQCLLVRRDRREDDVAREAADEGCHSPAEKAQAKYLGLVQISCRHGTLSPSACSIAGSHEETIYGGRCRRPSSS
jgi:hypothetical protein